MEKINIEKLAGNKPVAVNQEQIPYKDIELLAEKLNEVIDKLNEMSKCKCGDSMCSECN